MSFRPLHLRVQATVLDEFPHLGRVRLGNAMEELEHRHPFGVSRP